MPLYAYKALDETGKKLSGMIDADSLQLAKEKLKRRQLFITDISNSLRNEKGLNISSTQLLNFTRELSSLLKAGLPLYESLVTIEEKYRNQKIHPLFIRLCDALKTGSSFSSALSAYPSCFDVIYLSMVKAAEKTGRLAETFEDLSNLITKQNKLKKQLFSSLAYPAFLGAFCFCVVIALFFFVIPSMQELFEGRHLHPLTACVISISSFLNECWLYLLLSFLASLLGLFYIMKIPTYKKHFVALLYRIPLIKKVAQEASLVRFCRAMALLLQGGVPLASALGYARNTMKNVLLESVIDNAIEKIVEGKKLSSLIASPYMPSLVTRMVAIAEETGNLESTMKNLSEIYDEDLNKDLQHLTSFLQPLVLIFLGLIVGIVVLSILIPLTDVGSFISN